MIDKKYLEIFLDEVSEHIEDLNKNLLELEQDYENTEIINEIFRVAHTLKSSAAFVGLEYLSKLSHRMEDLFQLIKDKKIKVKTELLNLLFQCLDIIKKVAAEVVIKEDEDKEPILHLIQQIDNYIQSEGDGFIEKEGKESSNWEEIIQKVSESPEKAKKEINLKDKILTLSESEKIILSQSVGPNEKVYSGYVSIDPEAPMKLMRLLLIYNKLVRFTKVFKINPNIETVDKSEKLPDYHYIQFIVYGAIPKNDIVRLCQIDLVEEIHIREIELKPVLGNKKEIIKRDTQIKKSQIQMEQEDTIIKTKTIKVSSEKIDYILNNVGELVITNSGLQKIYADFVDEIGENQLLTDLKNKIDQAIRIARELQLGIMKMRMMPVGIVFQRYYRPVRDLSLSLGKKVELIIQGEDTEVDKNIVDSLNDPLMHLVRNAIDHGIESPEERIKKGKPEVGKLFLKAYQSGNHIFIEVQDDGKGLDKDKIFRKAVEMGIVQPSDQLSDQEIYELIFNPNLSTAEQISNISGRGVGMNVVKQIAIEYKGSIHIHTVKDEGTSFILMFPLTLAIISTIHIKIHKEEYAFPLTDVVETIRISSKRIISLQGKNIINLRNEIVLIYELRVLMGLPSRLNLLQEKVNSSEEEIGEEEEFPVVITTVGNRKVGYIVDEIIGKREIVIKSLSQNYKNIQGLIGACLLGDGSIVLILDVNTLLELSQKNIDPQILAKNQEIIKAIEEYNYSVDNLTAQSRKVKKKIVKVSHKARTVEEEIPEEIKTIPPVEIQKATLSGDSETITQVNLITIDQHETNKHETPEKEISIPESEEIWEDFQKEKERRIDVGLKIFSEWEDKKNDISLIKKDDFQLSQQDYEKLYSVVNSGMVNGGLVLSQLLGVTIDVSVPEFKTISYSEIKDMIADQKYYIIFLETTGEFESVLVLLFDEDTGLSAACELMGIPENQRNKNKIVIEDVRSVLNELTNIVGSSLLNEIANKARMTIKPSVPEFHYTNRGEILKLLEQKKHPTNKEKIIYIGADFLKDEKDLLSKMFVLPSRPDLIQLVSKIQI